jgi:pimeloyl-ACP methyl ester carboxylesterase
VLTSDTIALPAGRHQLVYRAGSGPPVVWLHGLNGVEGDQAIIDRLAGRHTVLAPLAPGFHDLDELGDIRDIHDLALHYDDLFDALQLNEVTLLGHSFGAMIAAEIAAHFPPRFRQLVLVSPLGLWNDQYPVTDVFAVPMTEMPRLLYVVPPASTNGGGTPDVEALVTLVKGMTTVARFLWPIPDRGLSRRLYRVRARTLVVHGEEDGFVPVRYADDFVSALSNAEKQIMPGAAHMLPQEQTKEVAEAIERFLEAQTTS